MRKIQPKRSNIMDNITNDDIILIMPSSQNDNNFIITQKDNEIYRDHRFDVILGKLNTIASKTKVKMNIFTQSENGTKTKFDI